jgi:hypothetical protein
MQFAEKSSSDHREAPSPIQLHMQSRLNQLAAQAANSSKGTVRRIVNWLGAEIPELAPRVSSVSDRFVRFATRPVFDTHRYQRAQNLLQALTRCDQSWDF